MRYRIILGWGDMVRWRSQVFLCLVMVGLWPDIARTQQSAMRWIVVRLPYQVVEVMKLPQAFARKIILACYEALAAEGFTRFAKNGVDCKIHNGFHAWVGLNNALRTDYFEISPFVGVHVVSIEKLWTSLKRGKYPAKYDRGVATYARHLGELAPSEPVFYFSCAADIDTQINRLVELYKTIGLEFARSIATYEKLLPLLQERAPMLGAYPERVACCLYLMGQVEEAISFSEAFLKEKPEYFEGFAVPFLKMLGAPPY